MAYVFRSILASAVPCAGASRIRLRLRPNQKAKPATNTITARAPITIPAIAPPLSPESLPLSDAWVPSEDEVAEALAVSIEEELGEDVLVVEPVLKDAVEENAALSWAGGGALKVCEVGVPQVTALFSSVPQHCQRLLVYEYTTSGRLWSAVSKLASSTSSVFSHETYCITGCKLRCLGRSGRYSRLYNSRFCRLFSYHSTMVVH